MQKIGQDRSTFNGPTLVAFGPNKFSQLVYREQLFVNVRKRRFIDRFLIAGSAKPVAQKVGSLFHSAMLRLTSGYELFHHDRPV